MYGLESDRRDLEPFPDSGFVYHSLDNPDAAVEGWGLVGRRRGSGRYREIAAGFDQGHHGTAALWAHLIQTRPERYLVHFDADVIFRGPALDDITDALAAGHSLVGPARPYKHNPNSRDDVRHLPDITQTVFIGFDRTLVQHRPFEELVRMIQGRLNPLGFPVID